MPVVVCDTILKLMLHRWSSTTVMTHYRYIRYTSFPVLNDLIDNVGFACEMCIQEGFPSHQSQLPALVTVQPLC